MSARSKLTRREIHGVLRALRNLDHKKRMDGEVVATAGEILGEDEEKAFDRDSATDDTRVRTAVSWLEDAVLLTREQNRVQVFPSSLRVNSVQEARFRLGRARIADAYRRQLLTITEALLDADADEGISTDELMNASGRTPEGVCGALHDLGRLGIASNDTALTAFDRAGVRRTSRRRFLEAEELEQAFIDLLRETASDMGRGASFIVTPKIAGPSGPFDESNTRVDGLAAGASRILEFTWTARVGTHTFTATADSRGTVPETDESNNVLEETVLTTLSDLNVTDIQLGN